MNNQPNSDLDDVLNALSVCNIPQAPTVNKIIKVDKDEEYDEHAILSRALRGIDDLINSNADVLEEAKRLVESTGDVEYIESYSSLSKAQSEAYKNIVQIITTKEKNKILKETKEQELVIKNKLVDYQMGELAMKKNALPNGSTLNQTNVIMTGSREEALEFVKKMQLVEKEQLELSKNTESDDIAIDIENI
jgi:hypothetical protein